ncbi:hypothetical protein ZWY2020_043961 [Hordeum vulgare]|nr:hypothetical protein ZWY2020_043961 [Hordeum vulgare]
MRAGDPYRLPASYPSARGKKRALLVGISYSFSKYELKGTVNDVNCIAYLLRERFGFPSDCILSLTAPGGRRRGGRCGVARASCRSFSAIRGTPSSLAKLLRSPACHPLLSAAPTVAFVQLLQGPSDLTTCRPCLPTWTAHGTDPCVAAPKDSTTVVCYAGCQRQTEGESCNCLELSWFAITMKFLQKTSEFADLILFTAGLEGYAKPLIDRIDAHNRFYRRFYRPSTVTTPRKGSLVCPKISVRVVLVDNNPYSFLLQPLNGIPYIRFSAGQPMDDQLMRVIFPLLKHLSLQNDVRPALRRCFICRSGSKVMGSHKLTRQCKLRSNSATELD